jgi:hypothetical protein
MKLLGGILIVAVAACGSTPSSEAPKPETREAAWAEWGHDCGFDRNHKLSTHRSDQQSQPELHLVGIYESQHDHDTEGTFHVKVERPGRVVLVVMAYEGTRWVVTSGADTTVERVLSSGYEEQRVDAPGVDIDEHAVDASFFKWPAVDNDDVKLLERVLADTGLSVTSFTGCYNMSRLTIQ